MTKVSMKRDIYLYLFGIVFSLSGIYTLLINQSYHIGLVESAKYGFLYELKVAENDYINSGQLSQSQSSTFQVYLEYNDIPKKYRQAFDWGAFKNDTIHEQYIPSTEDFGGEYLYATLHRIPDVDVILYVVSSYDETIYLDLLEISPSDSKSQLNTVLIIIGGLLIFVFFIIRVLVYRLTNPILILSDWSKTLDLNKANKLKNFRYKEIDLLATQLIDSVINERNTIEREEFFLRAASHELRTPVSVISASSEMLERLSEHMPKSGQRAVARISRSVSTMRTLITTLLWMSRNERVINDKKVENPRLVIIEIIDNHRHLLNDKNIAVSLNIDIDSLNHNVSLTLFQITATNLIRNAFQHCNHGTVKIKLTTDHIEVTNPIDEQENINSTSKETSFGIGSILIQKVCNTQGWEYTQKTTGGIYSSSVHFSKT